MKQKVKKRATSAIPIITYEKEDIELLVKELIEIIKATNWDYKSEFGDLFRMRDKALVSLLVLSEFFQEIKKGKNLKASPLLVLFSQIKAYGILFHPSRGGNLHLF